MLGDRLLKTFLSPRGLIMPNLVAVCPTVYACRQWHNYSPTDPAMQGAQKVEGPLLPLGKEIVALGRTSADHLILIHQVKQSDVNRRNAT